MKDNICTKCKQRERRGKDTYCAECRRQQRRESYHRNIEKERSWSRQKYLKDPDYYKKVVSPEKEKARKKLRNLIARGKITRLPCVVCGEEKTHGHHEDYSKPLEVIWLCVNHHALLHRDADFRKV